LRLPPGYERIEAAVRERCAAQLSRGNIQATLSVDSDSAAHRIKINEDVLDQVVKAMERIGGRLSVQPPTLDGILSIRGVLDVADAELDETERAALDATVLAGLATALSELVLMRAREGAAIGSVLSLRLDEIERLVRTAEESPARAPETIRERLAEQIAL